MTDNLDSAFAPLFLNSANRASFARDVYFREMWAMLADRWQDPIERLWPLAALVLKPDGVVARAGPQVLKILREEGFVPVGVQRFRFDRHIMRASWRFHVPVPDLDRLRIVDRLMTATDSLFILVRDVAPEGLPATVRVTKLKGGATGEAREARQIRERLGVEHSLITLVHTTDAPADLVRDLGVYFAPAERRALLEQVDRGGEVEDIALSILEDLHREEPPHDLDFDRSVARVRHEILAARVGDDRKRALALLDAMVERRSYDWPELETLARAAGASPEAWDLTTIGAVLTAMLVPPEPKTLPKDTISA